MIPKLAANDALLPSVDLIDDQTAIREVTDNSRFDRATIDRAKGADSIPIDQAAPAHTDVGQAATPQDPKPNDPLSVLKTMTPEETIALFT